MQSSIPECIDYQNWTVLLSQTLGIPVVNKGIEGQTSTQLLARFQTDVLSLTPICCIIEEGANDILNGITVATSISNIGQMVTLCQQNNIIPMIMCSSPGFAWAYWYATYAPTVTPVNWEAPENAPALRAAEQSYCTANNISYIDVYNPLLLTSTSQNPQYYTIFDHVHPSIMGYKKIADAVIPHLQAILGGY